MQQVTSHIPLVNQIFSDLAGFSGFLSRSPKWTRHTDSKNKHSKMELPYPCREHCVWAQRWHYPVFWNHQDSLSLPLCGKQEGLWGYWRMILSASSWNYFIASCLVWTFPSASPTSGPSTQSLSGESCSSSHSFSDFSICYLIPAIAGNQWQHAPTRAACEGPFIAACTFNFWVRVLEVFPND